MSSRSLESYRQVCLIRVGAQLCRTLVLQDRSCLSPRSSFNITWHDIWRQNCLSHPCIKRIVHPKKIFCPNIYSSLRCFRSAWMSLFCWTKKTIFPKKLGKLSKLPIDMFHANMDVNGHQQLVTNILKNILFNFQFLGEFITLLLYSSFISAHTFK